MVLRYFGPLLISKVHHSILVEKSPSGIRMTNLLSATLEMCAGFHAVPLWQLSSQEDNQ